MIMEPPKPATVNYPNRSAKEPAVPVIGRAHSPFASRPANREVPPSLPGLGKAATRERARARARPSVKLGQLLDSERRSQPEPEPGRQDLVRLDSAQSMVSADSIRRGLGRPRGTSPVLGKNAQESSRSIGLYSGIQSSYRNSARSRSDFDDSMGSFWYDDDDEITTGTKASGGYSSSSLKTGGPDMNRAESRKGLNDYASSSNLKAKSRVEFPRDQSYKTLEELAYSAKSSDNQLNSESFEMEIAPGCYVPFRNAKEVWRAVETNNPNNILECTCFECCCELVGIADCEHVVCPDCNMVNPVFDRPAHVQHVFGAGLGLKKEWVLERKHRG